MDEVYPPDPESRLQNYFSYIYYIVVLRKLDQTTRGYGVLLLASVGGVATARVISGEKQKYVTNYKKNSPFLSLSVTGSEDSRKHFRTAIFEKFNKIIFVPQNKNQIKVIILWTWT